MFSLRNWAHSLHQYLATTCNTNINWYNLWSQYFYRQNIFKISTILLGLLCQSNRIHSSPSPRKYSLVTLPLPRFKWGSCTIFSYYGYYANQIRIHSSPSPFLGLSGVRARSLVITVIMSIKSYLLVTLPLPEFSEVRARSLVFCVMFCRLLFVLLAFLFLLLYCLSFHLQLLITHLGP